MRQASLLAILFCVLAIFAPVRADERPPDWAQPMVLPGVPNLHRVTPWLYRSAQPTLEGFRALEKQGIKTVINLRSNHPDERIVNGTSIRLLTVDMDAWNIKMEDVVLALSIIRDPRNHPILVHCQHGADRTGVVLAAWRMAEKNWDKDSAMKEMKKGGYGFHRILLNIPKFIERLDVSLLRARISR